MVDLLFPLSQVGEDVGLFCLYSVRGLVLGVAFRRWASVPTWDEVRNLGILTGSTAFT